MFKLLKKPLRKAIHKDFFFLLFQVRKMRVVKTFYATVVDFALFVGFSAEEPLEVGNGGERVKTPIFIAAGNLTKERIQPLDIGAFAQSFAVRRVGNDYAAL